MSEGELEMQFGRNCLKSTQQRFGRSREYFAFNHLVSLQRGGDAGKHPTAIGNDGIPHLK
jgi:hypothetical protein